MKDRAMKSLHWLALTALMTGLMSLPYVTGRIGAIGLTGAMANPTGELVAKQPEWVRRGRAAHYNAVENLVVFGTLVLIAQDMNLAARPSVVFASALYFFARLAHYVIYSMGVPGLRTAAWGVGFAATLIVSWAIFIG
jgi:uncharacterized MAPEG superfamily protein